MSKEESPSVADIAMKYAELVSPAAANKAAEEGGLPARISQLIFDNTSLGWDKAIDLATAVLVFVDADRAAHPVGNNAEVDLPDYKIYAVINSMGWGLEDSAKDELFSLCKRVLRKVANKAEVDLSSLFVQTGAEIETVYVNREEEFVRLDDVKALLVTPPATTGASTAPRPTDDELWDATIRDRDAYHEWADNLAYAIAVHFDVDIGEHSNQNLPWAEALEVIENAERVGASTVLTDERIIAEAREWGLLDTGYGGHIDQSEIIGFAREVAAQVGQVAVPGWINVDDRLPEFRHECTSSGCEVSDSLMVYGQNEFGTTGCGFGHARDDGTWSTYEAEYYQLTVVKVTHWMPLPAAPSPAKESK